MKTKLHSLLLTLALFTGVQQAAAQGTAFTYQGQLSTNGSAANGSYDLQLILYNAGVGGSQTGKILTNAAVAVVNGLFTTTLDFGGGILTGSNYWLDLSVRTNGNGTFTEISPRQQLTPVPYAIFANTASNLIGTVSTAQLTGTIGNGQLANGSLTLTAGPGLSGGGAVVLGGATTLSNAGVVSVTGNADITASTTGGAVTLGDNATSANTASMMVKRDGSGNFSAGTITANSFSGGGANLTSLDASQLTSIGLGSGDAFLGSAGNATTTGQFNTGSGRNALAGNTSGADNTATGFAALNANTSGDENTAIGSGALYNNTNGFNTATGAFALLYNTSGFDNTANGYAALFGNTSGNNNIALGYQAGGNITTGSGNIDIGNLGISGDTNIIRLGSAQTQTFIAGVINGDGGSLTNLNAAQLSSGVIPLAQLPAVVVTNNSTSLTLSGTFSGNGGGLTSLNAANLTGALPAISGANLTNLSAAQLTSIGLGAGDAFLGSAGNATTTGQYNTGSGLNALAANTSGADNTATGSGALHANNTGTDNTGYGYNALHVNTIGSGNTATGSGALFNNGSGSNNIALGFNAGVNITTGSSNIDIGNLGVSGDANLIRIGTAQTATYLPGTVYANSVALTSDRNAKENFTALDGRSVLDKVASLPVTEWNYKTESREVQHIGPMAQDFQAAFHLSADDKHISVVDEGGVALAAIQGLNQKLEETEHAVKARDGVIQTLKEQNGALAERLHVLEATVKKLTARD